MDTVTLELSFLFIWIFCLHFRRRLILAYKTNQAKRIATWKIYFVYFLYAGFIMINLIILAHIIIVCSTVEAFREFNWYFISFFYWTDYAFRCFRYLRNEGVDLGWFFFFFWKKLRDWWCTNMLKITSVECVCVLYEFHKHHFFIGWKKQTHFEMSEMHFKVQIHRKLENIFWNSLLYQ